MDDLGLCDGYTYTQSGRQVDIFDPQPKDICIEDIAHGLANICRFSGQISHFYSVAEHSVLVMAYGCRKFSITDSSQLRAFLFHDASEAYIGDIIKPLKKMMSQYCEIESRWMKAIQEAFDFECSDFIGRRVKYADSSVCRAEAMELVNTNSDLWNWGVVEPADVEIKCMEPYSAKHLFMHFANELMDSKTLEVVYP